MAKVKKGHIAFAKWEPISHRSRLANRPVRLTVHITAVRANDIYGPNKGPGGTYAHCHNSRNGVFRQHQETHKKAYADLRGNGKTIAIENEGRSGDRLTAAQIDNLARVFAYAVTEHGVPNRIATPGDTRGLAWHRLGVRGNFGTYRSKDRRTWDADATGELWSTAFGKTCPTNNVIDQIPQIFEQAQAYIDGKPVKKPSRPQRDRSTATGSKKKVARKSRRYARLRVDGDWGPVTTTALQILLAEVGYYKGRVDGDFGPLSAKAVQLWLRDLGYYNGWIDGDFGPLSKRALQSFLRSKGLYTGRIDGKVGPMTVKALQRYLNDQRKYL